MLLQDSDKPPVTLHDVAAYFSEEEWKLLHEWQKELYKNVMNEIHQALVSLGMHSLLFCPLIVTSVCSLRARDKEDTCPVDSQSSGRSYCGKPTPTSNEVVSVVIKEEEEEPDDAENQESIHSPIAADPVITSVFTLSRNPQDEMNFQEQTQPEEEHMAEPVITFVCSLSNKPDDEMNFQQEPEHEEQTTEEQITTRKEEKEKHQNPKKLSHRHKKLHHHPGTTSAVCERVVESADAGQQLIISPKPKCTEEEDMTWSALAINGPVHNGDRIMSSSMNTEDSVDCLEMTAPYKALSESNERMIYEISQRGTYFSSPLLSETAEEFEDELNGQCASAFSIPNMPSQSTPNWQIPESTSFIKHRRSRTGHTSYQCSECGKIFACKTHLVRHRTKHTGEKPYQCDECEKSFTQKGSLTIHQRIHSGELPYPCVQCGISFREKKHLVAHIKKIHML
ncbi:zinc finger protein 398-like isoform X2 [Ambystoma mexicanum]|uniref:zinc finger protein 398-like isoform X2 n=1 Tax=Ambystoma mexicanum TaxID=8296 RepID=UPI0037E7070D